MISDYQEYTDRLRELLVSVADDGLLHHQTAVASALDGQAAAELRNLVPLNVRRERGAFFTTSELRRKALSASPNGTSGDVYFDPACGAGDLLVEAAKGMPVFDSFESTVEHWSGRLLGCDVEPYFVEAAKLRLLLAAAYQSGQPILGRIPSDVFPGLVVGDGLAQQPLANRSDHIVLNPPFGYVRAPNSATWARGRVSEAAVFLARLLEDAPVGASITAILPDVLRSGTRYRKWRALIESMVTISQIESQGVFDESTDIDVFLLRGTRSAVNDSDTQWADTRHVGEVVGDFFNVHVGPVVPHRDPESGPWHPFIWPKRLPSSGPFNPEGRSRRFAGRTFSPPFVAIRRTSRPGQKRRAGGVLVVGDYPVAVENHLLVALPKNDNESSCLDLMDVLEDQQTRDWLDRQIRTRHLTVSAIRGLPWLRPNADG